MAQYAGLSRAQLSYDYLHTNSTTHEFLFGGLAELVDNARDASATKLNIYTVPDPILRGGFMLCFLDDGEGMTPENAEDIVMFGKSGKRSADSQHIGMYGNGLKSGSMRIGNDLIVFTKKGPQMTCVFLSRTFHETEEIDEIIVPIPVFETTTKKPSARGADQAKKHAVEMSIILRYSPFKTEAALMREFDRIEGNSGTLVIIYNMKLLDSGEPELDIKKDAHDILLTNPDNTDYDTDEGLMPERRSFRAYTAILYVEPRMRIYIQGKKVRTKRLANCLYKPRIYRYISNRFRTRSEQESKRSQDEARGAENRAKEAQSKAMNLENKYGTKATKEQRTELRKAQANAVDARREAQLKKQIAERKMRALRDPKSLSFIFGMNIDNRSQDGMFVYNCNRMIKMYQKVGPQADGGVFCSGVVGIVDVPYLVLEPTHNKQDFADAKEYRHLQKAMGEHMVQYWKDVGIAQQGVTKFWETFGYISPNWKDPPSQDPKYIRKRAMQLQVTLQCDLCLKWRMLPFSNSNVGRSFPDEWICSNNPDQAHNRCSAPEQKLNIPEGILRKEVKTKEQKQAALAEEIRKKQEQLQKLQKTKIVTSSRVQEESESDDEPLPPPRRSNDTQRRPGRESEGKRASISSISRRPSETPSRRHSDTPRRMAATSTNKPSGNMSPTPTRVITVTRVNSSERKSAKRRVVRRRTSSDDDELDKNTEEDEDEEDEPPPKKKAPTPKPKPVVKPTKSPATTSSSSKVMLRSNRSALGSLEKARLTGKMESEESESEIEERSSRSHAKTGPLTRGLVAEKADANDKDDGPPVDSDDDGAPMETNEPDDGQPGGSEDEDASDIGTKVEAKVQNKWYAGKVVAVNKRKSMWKVNFNKYPKDKYNKCVPSNVDGTPVVPIVNGLYYMPLEVLDTDDSPYTIIRFDQSSAEIKVVKTNDQSGAESSAAPQSPASVSSQDAANETPSSSTPAAGGSGVNNGSLSEDIANGYRTCLRYFLPPQWVMDKEAVSALSIQELASFPLDDFFDHYEKGLRKLVSSFQLEAAAKQQESEQFRTKLSNVRKMIAKLLKSINEEFDIDPESDSDQVDDLLAACVQQALQQSSQ